MRVLAKTYLSPILAMLPLCTRSLAQFRFSYYSIKFICSGSFLYFFLFSALISLEVLRSSPLSRAMIFIALGPCTVAFFFFLLVFYLLVFPGFSVPLYGVHFGSRYHTGLATRIAFGVLFFCAWGGRGTSVLGLLPYC